MNDCDIGCENISRFQLVLREDCVELINYVELYDAKLLTKHISIGFKEYDDAVDCYGALKDFCYELNKLVDENKRLRKKLGYKK